MTSSRFPLAATMVRAQPADASTAVLCSPGGMLRREYLSWGRPSLVDVLAGSGVDVVAVDNLGTGDSMAESSGGEVTLERAVDALSQSAAVLRADHDQVIGLGHSMGAWITAAAAASFDAVALLGYAPAWRWTTDVGPAGREQRRAWLLTQLAEPGDDVTFPSTAPQELLTTVPRGLAAEFGSSDDALAVAGAITRPVWLGYGSDDVADPAVERGRYEHAASVTTYTLAGASHLHALEPNAALLWREIAAWISTLGMGTR